MKNKLFYCLLFIFAVLSISFPSNAAYSGQDSVSNQFSIVKFYHYTIQFNGNGATSGSMSPMSMTGTSPAITSAVGNEYAKTLTPNAFSRTGYLFQGWSLTASGSVKYADEELVSNLEVNDGDTITLYAVWKPITYKIVYHSNLGVGTMPIQTCMYNVSYSLLNNEFIKVNNQFEGWSLAANMPVVYDNMDIIRNLSDTQDAVIDLYAVWSSAIDLTAFEVDDTSHNCLNYLELKGTNEGHWKECSVCGKHYDLVGQAIAGSYVKHHYTDTWTGGSQSNCSTTNHHVFTCNDCGYKFSTDEAVTIYGVTYPARAEHSVGSEWRSTTYRHFHKCQNCSYTTDGGKHTLKNGTLVNCENPGTCYTCGKVVGNTHSTYPVFRSTQTPANQMNHISTYTCDCDFQILRDSNDPTYQSSIKVSYSGDIASVTVNMYVLSLTKDTIVTPAISNIKFKIANEGEIIPGSVSYDVNQGNGRITLKFQARKYNEALGSGVEGGIITYTTKSGAKASIHPTFYFDSERTAPVITNVDVTNVNSQTDSQGLVWATSKNIEVSGTENFCNTVNCTLTNKATNKVVGQGSVTVNKFGVWSWTCNPQLEIKDSDVFVLTVKDSLGSVTTQEVMLDRTDSKAPTLVSDKETSKEWTTTKKYRATFEDLGAGDCSIALNLTSNYQNATKDGNRYYRDYTFGGDVYGEKKVIFHCEDIVGNSVTEGVSVWNIDNTAPTISTTPISGNAVTINANDKKVFVENGVQVTKDGSGVVAYGYINKVSDTSVHWSSTNTFTLPDGSYELFAKDKVGNISKASKVVIGEVEDIYLASEPLVGSPITPIVYEDAEPETEEEETSTEIEEEDNILPTKYRIYKDNVELDVLNVEEDTLLKDIAPIIDGYEYQSAFVDGKEVDKIGKFAYHLIEDEWVSADEVILTLRYSEIPLPEESENVVEEVIPVVQPINVNWEIEGVDGVTLNTNDVRGRNLLEVCPNIDGYTFVGVTYNERFVISFAENSIFFTDGTSVDVEDSVTFTIVYQIIE